jgi:hypothetical protein
MLTAQEGRLQIDIDASLNTGGQPAQRPRRRIGVPEWPIPEHSGALAGVKTGGIAAVLNRR